MRTRDFRKCALVCCRGFRTARSPTLHLFCVILTQRASTPRASSSHPESPGEPLERPFSRPEFLTSQLLSIHRFGYPLVDGLTRRVALLFRTGCVFTSLSVSSRPPLACHPDGVPLLLVHSSLCLWLRLSKLVNGFVQSAARAEQSSTVWKSERPHHSLECGRLAGGGCTQFSARRRPFRIPPPRWLLRGPLAPFQRIRRSLLA